MQKTTIALVFGLAGLAAGSWLSTASSAAGTSYGEDRAQIEDLQARYLFALDFHDPKLYASTFTPDGILDYGEGDVKGREAIIKVIGGMPGVTRSRTSSSRSMATRPWAVPRGSTSATTTRNAPIPSAASATTRTRW